MSKPLQAKYQVGDYVSFLALITKVDKKEVEVDDEYVMSNIYQYNIWAADDLDECINGDSWVTEEAILRKEGSVQKKAVQKRIAELKKELAALEKSL
jgi:hypothetical protein